MKRLAKAAETAKAEMNAMIDMVSLLLITKYIMNDSDGKGKIILEKKHVRKIWEEYARERREKTRE